MTVNVFAVPVFFVIFRETLETVIIVSVLLAFLKQTLDGSNRDAVIYKRLVRQVGYNLLRTFQGGMLYSRSDRYGLAPLLGYLYV
jgi:high-affinity Fe2+/Pb2+ permease